MTRRKQPQRDARRGVVSTAQSTGPAPKLPHETDESTQGMQDGPRDKIRQAHDDVQAGRSDTSRGEATDPTYHKLRKS